VITPTSGNARLTRKLTRRGRPAVAREINRRLAAKPVREIGQIRARHDATNVRDLGADGARITAFCRRGRGKGGTSLELAVSQGGKHGPSRIVALTDPEARSLGRRTEPWKVEGSADGRMPKTLTGRSSTTGVG